MIFGFVLFGFALLCGDAAYAHDPLSDDRAEQWAAWLSVALLAALGGAYMIGAYRQPPKLPLAMCFAAAFILCAYAVLGPLDEWAEVSAAAHMSQHMLFIVVIAPLFVISRPLPQLVAVGGKPALKLLKPVMRLARRPMLAAYIHGAIIWFWHVPYFYNLALDDPWVHVLEHAMFIVSAGLFWWAVLAGSRYRTPWSLLALLFTMMHTGFLGAVLTFAQEPLYGEARDLADQQLAGLIMWVACALPYMSAALWISWRWYHQIDPAHDARAG